MHHLVHPFWCHPVGWTLILEPSTMGRLGRGGVEGEQEPNEKNVLSMHCSSMVVLLWVLLHSRQFLRVLKQWFLWFGLCPQWFFFFDEISPKFGFKSLILTYSKYFSGKKWPKFARFQNNNKSKSPDFNDKFQYMAKKIEAGFFFFFFFQIPQVGALARVLSIN